MFRSPLVMGIQAACSDAKYRTRYPDGVWSAPGAVLAANAADVAAASGVVSSGSDWQLAAGHFETARIALEIIAPRAASSAHNRYKKAYPGISYRLPVRVLGGAWPFEYKLTSAPSGMTIGEHYGDSDYGIINYPSPVAGTQSVTVQVTDQEGTVATVTYSIVVSTAGVLFIDSVHGNDSTGTGTISAPFASIAGWYGGTDNSAKYTSTFPYYMVYLRAGTHTTAGIYNGGNDVNFYGGSKPTIWLGYPGEDVTLDMTSCAFSVSGPDHWISDMAVIPRPNAGGGDITGWDHNSSYTDYGFFNLDIAAGSGGSVTNDSLFFSRGTDAATTAYLFISDCIFAGASNQDLFLGYGTSKCVIENNIVSYQGGNGFYAKYGNTKWSVRNNNGLIGNTAQLVEIDGYATTDQIEVCWNNYKSSGNGVLYGPNYNTTMGTFWQCRNTWQVGQQEVRNMSITSLNIANDVTHYTAGGSINSHGFFYNNDSASVNIASSSFVGEECVGTAAYTDSGGNLTGTYHTNYLGTRGHEVA